METENINFLKMRSELCNAYISKVEVAILYSINKRQHQTPSTEKTVENIKTKAKWKWLHVIIFFENNYFRFRAFEYWKLVLFFESHRQKKRNIETLKKYML